MGSSRKGDVEKNLEPWEMSTPGNRQVKTVFSRITKQRGFTRIVSFKNLKMNHGLVELLELSLLIGTAFSCACLQSQHDCTNKGGRFRCSTDRACGNRPRS